jgi:nucleoside-diphosphate-sugar epimerase
MIVCTGGSGANGQFLPETVASLETRLEASVAERLDELSKLLKTPQCLIHLAAMTSVEEARQNPEKAYDLNVTGTMKWLEAATHAKIPRFIFVSTSHVFQPTTGELLAPSRPTDAVDSYGRTKAAAENLVREFETSTEKIIARVFSVTSPNMRQGFLYPELLRRARDKDFSPLRGYQNIRDFIDAQSVASELIKFAEQQTVPSVVHIAGKTKSVRQLAEEVLLANGCDLAQAKTMFPPNEEPPNYLVSEKDRS